MIHFLILLLVLCTVAAVYLTFSLVKHLPMHLFWRVLLASILMVLCYLFPLIMVKDKIGMSPWVEQLACIAGGLTCYLFLFCLAKDVLLMPFRLFNFRLFRWLNVMGSMAVLMITLALSTLGYYRAYDTQVVEVEIPIPLAAANLADLRIVQLSDIHVTRATPKAWLEGIVAQTNALAPDIICITGDIADFELPDTAGLMEPLTRLEATYGVYFVDGNHEYLGEQIAQWREFVPHLGFIELNNSHHLIEYAGTKLMILGVPDPLSARFGQAKADVAATLQGGVKADLSILLAHRPELVSQAAPAGVNILLSGHTHAGQFFPFNYAVALAQQYMKGLYQVGSTQLYVNQGTGFWAIPNRLGTKSEITLLKLVPQSD